MQGFTPPAGDAPATLIVPALAFDGIGSEARDGCGILVEDGAVAAFGPLAGLPDRPGTVRIDLPEHCVLPGMIDLHNYLSVDPDRPDPMGQMYGSDMAQRAWVAARHLERDLRSGVTTMRIMGEGAGFDAVVRAEVEAGRLAGPRLLTSGHPITPTHGHQAPPQGGFDGVEGVRRGVRQNLRAGADWIKLCLTGGINSLGLSPTTLAYSREEMRVAVEEAGRVGKRVCAAAMGGDAIRVAMEEGVAMIEHGALMGEAEVEAMARHGGWLTLTPSRFFHPRGIELGARNTPSVMAKLERARDAMRRFVPLALGAGVRIVLGTDNMHGMIAADVRYLAELGADPAAALRAATGLAAEAAGMPDTGRIAEGYRADLVAVRGNPLEDIAALERAALVMKGGRVVVRE